MAGISLNKMREIETRSANKPPETGFKITDRRAVGALREVMRAQGLSNPNAALLSLVERCLVVEPEQKLPEGRTVDISQTVRQSLIRLGYDEGQLAACDVENAYRFIVMRSKNTGGQKPVRLEGVLDNFATARFEGTELNFFSPWGPRYKISTPEIEENSPEMKTIGELVEIFQEFVGFGYKPRLVLMPADTYGIEINNLPSEFVVIYFDSLSRVLAKELGDLVKLEIKPWSEIRNEDRERYDELYEEMAARWKYSSLPSRAVNTARFFNPDKPEDSARRYIIERMVEATIIEERYAPIKLSLVRKEKDELDGALRRIYIIRNKAPWMSSESQAQMPE